MKDEVEAQGLMELILKLYYRVESRIKYKLEMGEKEQTQQKEPCQQIQQLTLNGEGNQSLESRLIGRLHFFSGHAS